MAKLRHDLRTPVNHILGFAGLLAEDLADRGLEPQDDLEKICSAARKILEITDALAFIPNSREEAPLLEAAPSVAVERPATAVTPSQLGGRILVVDDNADNRETLNRRLTREGLVVSEAPDGESGLAMVRSQPFDLILLDVMMPGLDGPATLARLKADPVTRHVPVIMISALDEMATVIHCIEAGAEDYLPKPPDPILLRARIGACLQKKALLDQEREYLRTIEETKARLDAELQEAARYVASLLPPPIEQPLRICWSFSPSTELGGDAFGYHALDETHFAIYLLDVCGHGVGAALLSVAAINVLRSSTLPDTDFRSPANVLSGLNKAFQMEHHNNMYFTIWYGVYDVTTRTLRHASGGHPPALLLTPGQPPVQVSCPGMLVGVMEETIYSEASLAIPPGSRLLVFSDGAYELHTPEGKLMTIDDFSQWADAHRAEPDLPSQAKLWAHATTNLRVLDDDLSLLAIDFPARA